ncbi:transposase, IS605 OrfB family, central region [Dactylococcopsis salina PCC 8305]|uniref:Transposase, IS605 OrfB family, central region n=1 Tax=Dactylococcopsis salina (strain PCC 8305) TaxID=13035 RepID=K9YVH1_DACS8|nr:transposase, IS605 OrfB family, central region [Dactylococcopsis salina PCC 8305]
MKQVITAKLRLDLSQEQKTLLREVSLAYRDALNYISQVAFDNNRTSSANKLQKLAYYDIRDQYSLPSQMACNVCRQVGATYRSLWTKVKQNSQHRKQGKTKKRYKGLDNPPHFVSRTCNLNYGRDFSFVKEGISLITLQGRIKVSYSGYQKHLDLIKSGEAKAKGAKIYYTPSNKNYYLLVSLEIEKPDIEPTDIKRVSGVDVGQRYLAVETDTQNQVSFYNGKSTIHKANHYQRRRKSLQRKGTRSAKRRLKKLSGRERRFRADINHQVSKKVAKSNSLIGLEDLTHIRERTNPRCKGKKASKKQKKANRKQTSWSFAELQSFIDYKAVFNDSLAIKVDADYTSQTCPHCGHTSRGNRPNKGLNFHCENCGFDLHADLVGARNITMRTLLVRQDWASTGSLSACPDDPSGSLDVSSDEAKAMRLSRFMELRWTAETSPNHIAFSD